MEPQVVVTVPEGWHLERVCWRNIRRSLANNNVYEFGVWHFLVRNDVDSLERALLRAVEEHVSIRKVTMTLDEPGWFRPTRGVPTVSWFEFVEGCDDYLLYRQGLKRVALPIVRELHVDKWDTIATVKQRQEPA